MEVDRPRGEELHRISVNDEQLAKLARLVIDHSDDEELKSKLGAASGVSEVVSRHETHEHGGARADDLLKEEAFDRINASRPMEGQAQLRVPKPKQAKPRNGRTK